MLEIEALQAETVQSIYAKKDKNGHPSANKGLSTVEPNIFQLRVNTPTSSCSTLSVDADPNSQ